MENTNYTLRLEPKSPETIKVDRVREILKQCGFQETGDATPNVFCFVLNKPAYVLQARLETDGNQQYIQMVSVSLDVRRLLVDAISMAAAELSGIASSLTAYTAYNDNSQMMIYYEHVPGGQAQDCLEGGISCELCNHLEQQILQKKQSLRRFPAVSAEEALKWMEDFPQRKEKFVAAVREGKD